jgi:hypothetical protein
MSDAFVKLDQWLKGLHDEFQELVPEPKDSKNIIQLIIKRFQTTPQKYLGAGDNGIVFLCDDGDILKLTIDEKEAILWHRLKNKSVSGITHLKDVVNLASSKFGDSLIFVIKAEYAPYPVSSEEGRLITDVRRIVNSDMQTKLAGMRAKGAVSKERYWTERALSYVRAYQDLAKTNSQFSRIPDLLIDLADKHKAFVFDLTSDNFRKNAAGEVILVDPSVPDLEGDIVKPDKLFFENKLEFRLNIERIFY